MTTLASSAARGSGVTLLGQLVKFGVQLVGLVVLARLLSPRDYGLLAMITVIINLGDVIRDFGLSSAAVQARTLSQAQKSNLFWINSAIGVVLMIVIAACAGLVGKLYGEPQLTPMAQILSIVFLLKALQTQFQAELSRRMKFVQLAWTDVVAVVTGFVSAIVMALVGLAFWALVAQLLVPALVMLITRVSVARWWPSLPRRAPMRSLLSYGGNLMATQTLVYLSSNIDSFLIGFRFGPGALGFYNRAFQLLSLPLSQMLSPLTQVALPVLSRAHEQSVDFNRFLEKAQKVVGYTVTVMFSFGIACAYPLIEIVLGPEWMPSAGLFQLLAIGGIFQAIGYVSYWVFLAKGLTRSHFRYSLLSRTVLIAAVLIGSAGGVSGVAVGYAVGTALGWPGALWWLSRVTDIPAGRLLVSGVRILTVAALAASAGWTSVLLSGAAGVWAQLLAGGGAVAFVYVLSWLFLPAVRRDAAIVRTFALSAVARRASP